MFCFIKFGAFAKHRTYVPEVSFVFNSRVKDKNAALQLQVSVAVADYNCFLKYFSSLAAAAVALVRIFSTFFALWLECIPPPLPLVCEKTSYPCEEFFW